MAAAGTISTALTSTAFLTRQRCETIIRALMKEKGMEPEVGGLSFDYEKYREEQYNRLADTMRKYLDMEAIYRILEKGV